jgi:DNA-binding transcriptional LysR family regulator
MHSDWIDTFLDLAETRSFNRSAERLGLTQSTVSGRIAALEAEIGARLFTRSRAGTDLTTEGLKFLPHARAIRHAHAEARAAVTPLGEAAIHIRLGIQSDLAPPLVGPWMEILRARLPDCSYYLEPDFSAQMCRDLTTGALDFAILYTPHPAPDLHFTSLGEARYRLISSDADSLAGLDPRRSIRANFAPAFDMAHRAALPRMAEAPVAAGQTATIISLLARLGGSAYVLEDSAAELLDTGRFRFVADAPVIGQPVHAATHLKNRTKPLFRTLLRAAQAVLAQAQVRPGNPK